MHYPANIMRKIREKLSDYSQRIRLSRIGMKAAFQEKFDSSGWGSSESVSGPGSDLAQTEHIRQELPRLLKEYGIKSILDAPCGDFNWMKYVNLSNIKYHGGDIIEEIITTNTSLYQADNIAFSLLDITSDTIPRVDMILCRDCLIHFSYEHILQTLDNFKKSGSEYLLTTTFYNLKRNKDIVTGMWRPLGLGIEPFMFPDPLLILTENKEYEWDGALISKKLALWKLEDISI